MTRRRTMPWNLALCVTVFAAGCVFSADYGGGQYRCTDGKCPSGLVCSAEQRCVTSIPHDAPLDIPPRDAETSIDAVRLPRSLGENVTDTVHWKFIASVVQLFVCVKSAEFVPDFVMTIGPFLVLAGERGDQRLPRLLGADPAEHARGVVRLVAAAGE